MSAAPEPKAQVIALDPKASPVEFRRLADDAILVSPGLEGPTLAKLGNFIAAAARRLERAHLTVWDDEPAWKRAAEGRAQGVAALSDRRAEYIREKTPQPIETYTVFGRDGGVTYERNFRDWPLTDLDVAPLTD
ncbi:MAG: hypothetical protein QOD06_1477 [Candidatus Binatota bacterium]|nr:hypothetical protein [Candidatus Binatota bacterium]